MGIGYKLSPNEEQQLLKQENERRRKLRIIQVREQCKVNASYSRNAVKAERKRQIEILTEKVKFDLEKKRLINLEEADCDYDVNSTEFGLAHRNALAEISDPKHALYICNKENNNEIAKERHRIAIQVMKEEKLKKFNKDNHIKKKREQALEIEKVRSDHISSLPAPKPDNVDSLDLTNFKTMKPVKCTDVKAFTNTHYHINADSCAVEKADEYEKANDARKDASMENVEHDLAEKQRLESVHERNAKADLRYKHALRKENVKNDYNQLLHDLSDLQREDQNRRQKIVAKIPKQIFEAPFRRIESNKQRQNEIETAFEKMFIKKDDYNETEVPLLCQPRLPSEPIGEVVVETIMQPEEHSICTADSALDITIEASLSCQDSTNPISIESENELTTRDERIPDEFKRLIQDVNKRRLRRIGNLDNETDESDKIDMDETLTDESITYSALHNDHSDLNSTEQSEIESIRNSNSDISFNTVISTDIESEFKKEFGLSAAILMESKKQKQAIHDDDELCINMDVQNDNWKIQKKLLEEKLNDINMRRKILNANLRNNIEKESLPLVDEKEKLSEEEYEQERKSLLEHGQKLLSQVIKPIKLPSTNEKNGNIRGFDDALLLRPSPLREFQDITSSESQSSSARISLATSGSDFSTDLTASSYADLPTPDCLNFIRPPHIAAVDAFNEADYANLSDFINRQKSADSSYLPDELQPDSISIVSGQSCGLLPLSSTPTPSNQTDSDKISLLSYDLSSLTNVDSSPLSTATGLSSVGDFDMSRALEEVGIVRKSDNWLSELCRDTNVTLSTMTTLNESMNDYSRQFSVDSLDTSRLTDNSCSDIISDSPMFVVNRQPKIPNKVGYPVIATDSGMFSGVTTLAGTDVNVVNKDYIGKYSNFNDYRVIPSVSENIIKEQEINTSGNINENYMEICIEDPPSKRGEFEVNNSCSSLRGYQTRLDSALAYDDVRLEPLSPSLCLLETSINAKKSNVNKTSGQSLSRILQELSESQSSNDISNEAITTSTPQKTHPLPDFAFHTSASSNDISPLVNTVNFRSLIGRNTMLLSDSDLSIERVIHELIDTESSTLSNTIFDFEKFTSLRSLDNGSLNTDLKSINSSKSINISECTFPVSIAVNDSSISLPSEINASRANDNTSTMESIERIDIFSHSDIKWPNLDETLKSNIDLVDEPDLTLVSMNSTSHSIPLSYAESMDSRLYKQYTTQKSRPFTTSRQSDQDMIGEDLSESLLSFQRHEKSTSELEQCDQFETKRKKLMNSSERRLQSLPNKAEKRFRIVQEMNEKMKLSSNAYRPSVKVVNRPIKNEIKNPKKAQIKDSTKSIPKKKNPVNNSGSISNKKKITQTNNSGLNTNKKRITPINNSSVSSSRLLKNQSIPSKQNTKNNLKPASSFTSAKTKPISNIKELKSTNHLQSSFGKETSTNPNAKNKKETALPRKPIASTTESSRRSHPRTNVRGSTTRTANEFNDVFNKWKSKRSL